MYTTMKSYVNSFLILCLLACYNILMATTNEYVYNRSKELADRERIQKETEQLIQDTMKEVKWKEGKGKDGNDYYVYEDKVYDKAKDEYKYVKTIGNGINIDSRHGGDHNIRFLKNLVGEDAFGELLSGKRPISLDVNKRAVRYNIELGIKYARNAIEPFDRYDYEIRKVVTDMFYNMGGNVPKKMPSFIEALDQGRVYDASLELKHKNPFGKKGKPVDMDTTNYFDQTTGRGKLNFEVLNQFPNFIEEVTEEGVDISQGSNPNEAIFTFPEGM